MEFIIGKYNGFCKGVSRAVDTARKICGENVYILGELIHNKDVVDSILLTGTKVINSVDEVDSGTVIIRSHGASREIFEKLYEKNIEVVDCTCPFVKKIHNIVDDYSKRGYKIVILGEPEHPEVQGIAGWCNGQAIIIKEYSPELDFSAYEKVCIVEQTTYPVKKYNYLLDNFNKSQCKTVEIFSTICYTTFKRQQEAENLSEICDAMIVIGGQKSSNTKKLADICRKNCRQVFLIQNADEIDANSLKDFKKVGIVSGASTPKEQSMEVLTNMAEVTDVVTENNFMDEAVANFTNKEVFKKGDIIDATITSATDNGLYLYIGAKTDVLLAKEDIACEVYDKDNYKSSVGEDIKVMVVGTVPKLHVSQKAIVEREQEESQIQEIKDGKVFQVKIEASNKGGLTGKFGSYNVFIPSSQIRIGFVKDLDKYIGKTLRVKAERVENEGRRKQIVASQRVILEAEQAEREAAKKAKEDAFFASVHVDDVVTGKVVRFASFGAFVDVNGFDCLAHISDLAWNNINSPSEAVEIGKEYQFKVLKVNEETKKVSIGLKQLLTRPWDEVTEKYAVGDVITGKIVRIVPFGVFVEIEKGVDGLVHISQISHEWLENPTAGLEIGQSVDAKIMAIDLEKEKITLSIKATMPAPEKVGRKQSDEVAEKPKKRVKREKPDVSQDTFSEWKDSDFGGASIAELLNNK
ncbi:MAG: bifunctional 4-hydroxy-3-methylbut-2-enyl diphosphate reductase/30S ribosomal protein S1 [Christensenellaceae bacterium]